jgi:O-antigen/teichoic acid export membrane protein
LTVKTEQIQNDPVSSAIRNEVVSVGKHSVIYLFGRILTRAVGFFMIPIYTRFISPTNYGAMELIEILASVVMLVISMGVAETMSRFYYGEKKQAKRNEVVSTTIIGFGVLGVPIVILFLLLSGFISQLVMEDVQYRYYLQVAIATVWFVMLCEIGYNYLRMRYMAKLFVSITVAQLILALSLNIWFIVFLKLDILGVFYSTLITQSLVGIVLCLVILGKIRLHFSIPVLWRLIRFGLPLVPSRIGSMLGFVSNRFFLRWFASPDPILALTQVGLFSLGHKFGVIINRFVNVPFNSFWGPRRLDLLLSNSPGVKETVARICTYATMLSIYLALLLSSGIESVIEIMADPRYRGAHLVVPFVALAYVALGLERHFTTGILYRKKTIWSTYISVLALGVILAWNYFFVPKYGLTGAATSNLAGFVVRVTFVYIVSQRLYPIPFELGRIALMFITAFVLYVTSQALVFSSPYVTFLVRTSFVGLFPFVLFILRFYKEGELEFVGHFIRKGHKITEAFRLRFRDI